MTGALIYGCTMLAITITLNVWMVVHYERKWRRQDREREQQRRNSIYSIPRRDLRQEYKVNDW